MRKILLFAVASLIGWLPSWRAAAQESSTVPLINSERKQIGQVSLTDSPSGIILKLSLPEKPAGIAPGAHGFHIHGVGKCEPPFESAGDHFDPLKTQHGFLAKGGRHAGDLPNIHVPPQGALTVEFFVPNVRLKDGKNRLMDQDGSALVIHAKPDDYRSDPAGNAGDRVACAVIAPAK